MVPSGEVPMIASWEWAMIAASRASNSSLRLRSVMSTKVMTTPAMTLSTVR